MDSLKSKVKVLTASATATAAASAHSAAEVSSLAKASALARLERLREEYHHAAAIAGVEEKKLEGIGNGSGSANVAEVSAEDPAVLNAETNKLLSNQLVQMMEEHEAKEKEWTEKTAQLQTELEEHKTIFFELTKEKGEAVDQSAKSAERVTALEGQIEELKKELEEVKEAKAKEEAEHEQAKAALEEQLGKVQDEMKAEQEKAATAQKDFEKQKADLEAQFEKQKSELEAKLNKEKADLEAQLHAGARERRKMHNTIQELRGNVRVFARVRPFLPGDGASADEKASVTPKADGYSLQLRLKSDDEKKDGNTYSFSFDHVFSAETTQDTVFGEVSEFVQSALDGYNVCLFSYGQTGSGKTHTMQGTGLGDLRGIIPRAIERVGEYKAELEAQGWKYEMQVSFLEIYNETIRDLLRDEEIGEKKHEIKVNPDGSRLVTDLTIRPLEPTDKDAIEDVMKTAAKYRTVASTNMNDVSSRSHSVFTLHLTAEHAESNQKLKGMLNLVDLAGSERLKRSGVSGDQAKEAVSINKSLSALTDVFVSLGNKAGHVPYRNTKLTWLLQPSLSGDGKTLMLCNLSPTELSSQESLSSLRFASQVNKVELGVAKRSISSVGSDGSKTPPRRGGSDLTSPSGSRLSRPPSSGNLGSARKPSTKTPPPSGNK